MELKIFDSEEQWIGEILNCFQMAISSRIVAGDAVVHILLSGGKTPLLIYSRLAKLDLPWERLRWWLVDERVVSINDPNRNEFAIKSAFGPLWEKVSPSYMSWGEFDCPRDAANAYAARLQQEGPFGPLFSVFIAGVGEDGHTASLFPKSSILQEKAALAAATSEKHHGFLRLSLTSMVLERVNNAFVLLRGVSKASIADRLRTNDQSLLAVSVLNKNTRVLWLLREAD